ncbi:hypothetical protein niasHT_020015 [Heterodera trifolii]|uniref:Importin N-terminal domain-containing protein n=1 Tax=Heterodera trifolii TaxID=157864 RepID=A0ABD2L7X8_9BILA
MDINHVSEALRSTTVADSQGQASDYLKEISPVIGFPQLLLRLLQDEQLDCAVRQAAVIYFKNIICSHWEVDDEKKRWTLSEQDKVSVKQQIIPAIIRSPEPIRIHLCTSIQNIMRNDFPARWANFNDEILPLLRASEPETLMGTLLILHRLCKIYEYKRQKEKTPLVGLMESALPLLQERLSTLLPNQSQPSCILQKQILKIFYCLNQFTINLQILSMDQFSKWLHLLLAILEREVPNECNTLPEDERAETLWWKCKKWAIKIIQRIFERYGNKGNVDLSYSDFATQYSKDLVLPVINSLMVHVLNNFINGHFVSDEVLYFTLSHLSDAMNQAQVWQALKPHFEPLLKSVIFPLLQYSKEDEQMWADDVEEFLRFKYDVYEDLHQPSSAASTLLQMLCKRQGIMDSLLVFIIENLSSTSDVRQADGALHMVAIVSSQLLKLKKYRKDVEKLLDAHVIPRTANENRFVRLRACYVLHYASETPFKNSRILDRAIHSLVKCLKDDAELPVRVQAAIAIQSLINDHSQKGTVVQIVRPHISDLLINVLKLVKETRVEDLPAVVDTLIENFEEDVIPIAYDVTVQLVQTFHAMVVGQEDGNEEDRIAEDYSVGVAGILSTLETILGLLEEHPDIVKRVEPVVRSCITTIFDAYCETYFEEALSLTHSLVLVHISPEMWTVFDHIYKAFLEEGTSFFSDCAPVLHAFLTNDTDNFLSVFDRVQHFLAMCEKTLNDEGEDGCDESTKAHAAKMLEVFVLQCQGRASHFIPDILRLVFNQLQKESADLKLGQLKPQLLIILIAALYSDFQLCSNLFGQLQFKTEIGTFEWLIRELYSNRKDFEGVHDRKMLIWLLCRILADGNLPALFINQPEKFMEWLLTLFEDLQRCIKEIAERREDDSDSEDEESSEEDDDRMNGELKDSDDDVDEENSQYLMALEHERNERRERRTRRKSSTNKSMDDQTEGAPGDILSLASETTDSEEHHHFEEETDLEAFSTPLDDQGDNKPCLNVFVLFKHTLEEMNTRNSPLLVSISDQQRIGEARVAKLNHLMEICTREENLERSKRLAQAGGYSFDANAPVPTTFSFS